MLGNITKFWGENVCVTVCNKINNILRLTCLYELSRNKLIVKLDQLTQYFCHNVKC